MNIAEIKTAVEAGRTVHWAHEGYLVHRDDLGQYMITYLPNGSTIGLTDRSGAWLNGDEADFFISRLGLSEAAEQGGVSRPRTPSTPIRAADRNYRQGRKESGPSGFAIP